MSNLERGYCYAIPAERGCFVFKQEPLPAPTPRVPLPACHCPEWVGTERDVAVAEDVNLRVLGALGTATEDAMTTLGWWEASDESFDAVKQLAAAIAHVVRTRRDARWWAKRRKRSADVVLAEIAEECHV